VQSALLALAIWPDFARLLGTDRSKGIAQAQNLPLVHPSSHPRSMAATYLRSPIEVSLNAPNEDLLTTNKHTQGLIVIIKVCEFTHKAVGLNSMMLRALFSQEQARSTPCWPNFPHHT
jgi:hypothetical protein